MRVEKSDQVINLMDTNGRRNDVVNAYTIYMEILRELGEETGDYSFNRFPESLKQFNFYKEAIERSPEKFQKHDNYDWIIAKLSSGAYREAFEDRDLEKLRRLSGGKKFLKKLDNGIEDRARHYTSNLVKIGFTYLDRRLTPVGFSFVDGKEIVRDSFESLLPIDDTNLIFLRQLLKLRVYNKDCTRYYSPMMMCIYILLQNESINMRDLQFMVSLITPFYYVDPKQYIEKVMETSVEEFENTYINYDTEPQYFEVNSQPAPMDKQLFEKVFKNGKSKSIVEEYYNFYSSLVDFMNNKNEESLKKLFLYYSHSKSKIDKAFGYSKNIFIFDKKEPYNVANFLELNENNDYLQSEKLNSIIYKKFMGSKRHDSVKEYSDTFMRLLSVTGVVHLKNGIAKLKFRDLWTILFNDINLENFIFSNSTKIEYKAYEENPESSFYKHVSIEKILGIQKEQGEVILNNVADNLGVSTVNEAKEKLKTGVNDEFVEFIKENYPKEKTIQLLSMFSDRSNDKEIQSMVGSTASVPTIFEYLVGIAWYHISKKEYDVFSSFNLTMNADFTPETHAGGGDGDIIVHYDNTVVMLEVTLMNKQAQKRGEWEPVLRHSANLTIDVAPKKVVTFFIADELDDNTINIWRAVASVPLKSSREAVNKGRLARNVTIMPLKNNELVKIIEKNTNEEALIESIEDSFLELDHEFDSEWREEIIKDIM